MNHRSSKANQHMSTLLKFILLGLLIAVAYQTYQSKTTIAVLGNKSLENCVIECPQNRDKSNSMRQLCLTSEYGNDACFYVDNIILFKSYNGKSVVYDFEGKGQYVKENLKQIEIKLHQLTAHFYQINRQDLVNMIYAKKLDKCKNILYLCGEFDCAVPRRKYQDVEKLMYQYCSLMCQ